MTDVISPALHHVTLRTTKKQELIDWYGVVAGLDVVFEFPFGAWLTNDAANHRFALLAFPGMSEDPEKGGHTGIDHLAFEYASAEDLMSSYARLRDLGITPLMCLDHGMTFSLYYRDPDGNSVELQVDAFGDWERSTEFMRSAPQFAANPLGHFFDPEQVYQAMQSGLTLEDVRADIASYLPDPLPDVPFAPVPENER
jgi:catechol 2,3-dioxygenase